MTPAYKLLALDLDGTTFTPEGKITERTKLAINQARQSGVIVVVATGRGIQSIHKFGDILIPDNPLVLANGAEIWLKDGELLERRFLERDDVDLLYTLATSYDAHFWAYRAEELRHPNTWMEGDLEKKWIKFGIHHPEPPIMTEIRTKAQNGAIGTVTHSNPENIEVNAQGVSKKDAIEKICVHLGIEPQEVMAVGDSLNDLGLLQAAGLGVAMGNAEAKIKEIADVETAANSEDGVALAIEKYLLRTE